MVVDQVRMMLRFSLVLVLALGALCAVLLLNEHLVPAGDNSTYVVLAQSLATGRGYRMISDPRAPDMGLYPPAYPLLLAGVLLLTNTTQNLLAAILPLKVPSLILWIGALALFYDLLRRRDGLRAAQARPYLALMSVALMAVNLPLLHYAAEVGTEIPYLFCSLGSLWCLQWYERSSRKLALALTVLLLTLSFYVRSIALVMAVALAIYLLVQRKPRDGLALLLGVAILAAPWFVRGQSLPDTGTPVGLGRGYFDLYFSYDPYGLEPAGLLGWAERVAQNLRIYTLDIWPAAVFAHAPSLSAWLPGGFGALLQALITLIIVLGFVLEVRRGEASEYYVALFFLSCVGYLWAQTRLVVPILPFAFYYLLVALDTLLRRGMARLQRVPPVVLDKQRILLLLVCGVLLLSSLRGDLRRVRYNLRYGLGQPLAVYYSDDPEWQHYLRAMEWIAENGSAESIVMCRKADLMYIVTGHLALEYPYSADGMQLKRVARQNRVAYVIEDAFSWTGTTSLYLQPALQSWRVAEPEALALVFETDRPRTRVWRLSDQMNQSN